ncbi:peptidoglycan -binding protein [Gluconacetobacter entanii]|uniref:Peptidoglycan -binding protein n=1 Tax=Gluconacetobacter entanii TaxID=108528 RepID=A0A318Q0P7_9PROT|nr:peptidoglycan -binding protein [Gluconacetobacter entanii]MBE7620439.1 peptidoglycan -binding protein [Komagataeibacter sp. FXV2]MCE2579044.1 peptidoglycan -binding protein [Komagataeibacter sp. FNDCR1]MBY4638963.1 peptidoglycan -binding protein [Gluconacetobacter entanii]MCW4580041.1 peptidoglycan -binding protein [Gluconacetobacter entanii]MCW4583428.1 peptidoglycan -binding protein [Gluconacetobacter entanii]
MARRSRRQSRASELNAWPGYVDALSTLLMVIIFVLLVFVLGQAFLSVALNKRQQVLDQLQREVAHLSQMLSLEQGHNRSLEQSVATLQKEHAADEATETSLTAQVSQQAAERDSARHQADALNDQLAQLSAQLAAVSAALEISQNEVRDRDRKIDNLGMELNVALARKVEQLQRYRSEFFGRLRDVLKDTKGIQVVGDRFVFQSEVLFPVGSADLSPEGIKQIKVLGRTLKQVAQQIPPSVPWILRVDGHADRLPIHTAFPSNWELSSARAITVVKMLIADGIDPRHLAATGFADFQPLDNGTTPEAFARNRRIEFRLTDR